MTKKDWCPSTEEDVEKRTAWDNLVPTQLRKEKGGPRTWTQTG